MIVPRVLLDRIRSSDKEHILADDELEALKPMIIPAIMEASLVTAVHKHIIDQDKIQHEFIEIRIAFKLRADDHGN